VSDILDDLKGWVKRKSYPATLHPEMKRCIAEIEQLRGLLARVGYHEDDGRQLELARARVDYLEGVLLSRHGGEPLALLAELDEARAEIARLRERSIAVCGSCACGIGYIAVPDSIDSGATFPCLECGEPMTFDVSSPDARGAFYAEIERLRAENAQMRAFYQSFGITEIRLLEAKP
jgi:hypothetical protein